jgi:hypothetical protein
MRNCITREEGTMPARVVGFLVAVGVILGIKRSQPEIHDMDDHLLKAINKSYGSWVDKGIIEKREATRV